MEVRRMMLMSKIVYLIVLKGTKFTGSGKLGLNLLSCPCLVSSQARKLDVYFEMEEKLMSKQTLDKSLMDVISDPDAGTPEDKMRLFIIYYICTPSITDVSGRLTFLLVKGVLHP